MSASSVSDKGWIHVIRVHDTTHLAVTTTLRGSRRLRDYPPHSSIINERYNPKNNKEKKEKKQSMARTSPTPNHNPGRPQNR